MSSSSVIYQHRQPGNTILITLALAALLCITIALVTKWHPVIIIVLLLLSLTAYIFNSLTVTITSDQLIWYFGPGLWIYKINLEEITAIQTVENRWWYGWGIRLSPHGWLYNVDGLSAVEITINHGKHRRIGTDEPEKLANAITAAISQKIKK